MKYFTRDIWTDWQNEDVVVVNRAVRKWNRRIKLYRASLAPLLPRLGGRHGRFFTHHSLHDARLLSFAISDCPASPHSSRSPRTAVDIHALSSGKRPFVYHLRYTGIGGVDIWTKNDLFPRHESRFGSWGYDELLPEGYDMFRHNILFVTGTEISIVFRRFRFERRGASNRAV